MVKDLREEKELLKQTNERLMRRWGKKVGSWSRNWGRRVGVRSGGGGLE